MFSAENNGRSLVMRSEILPLTDMQNISKDSLFLQTGGFQMYVFL
jgi:hypothetical protein